MSTKSAVESDIQNIVDKGFSKEKALDIYFENNPQLDRNYFYPGTKVSYYE